MDPLDRAVGALLVGTVVACLGAAALVRPVPLSAAAAAHWSANADRLAAGGRAPQTVTIDGVEAGNGRLDLGGTPSLRRGAVLRVRGWTPDPAGIRSVGQVRFQVDGGRWRDARDHLARPDVARALRLADANVGYLVELPTRELAPGAHVLTIGSGAAGPLTIPAQSIRFAVNPR